MAKTQKKSSIKTKTSISRGRYILLALLILVVALPTLYLGYQVYLNNADAQKFTALKTDFMKLQVEFNKINPGWQYAESCVGRGGVYSGDETSSCAMSLSNSIKAITPQTVSDDYTEAVSHTGLFLISREAKAFQSESKEHLETILTNKRTGEKACDLLVTTESKEKMDLSITIGCSSSARSFYYDRIDR